MAQTIWRRDFLAAAPAAALPRARATYPSGALVSFRIGTALWLNDERFHDLLAYFRRFPSVADELAFFTSETHPPLPLEVIEQRAARLARLMPQVRKLGLRAGINVLATMGHHEEICRTRCLRPGSASWLYTAGARVALSATRSRS